MEKRITLDQGNLNPNFIGAWLIDKAICDDLIEYYEHNPGQQIKANSSVGLDQDIKDRNDISIFPKDIALEKNQIFKIYFQSLFECYKDYNHQWPFLASIVDQLDIGSFNIGKYKAGQHFQKVHCERSGLDSLHRLFAFMTYLNDVENGGYTYFNHYDLNIKPKKGLTIIWPAEWTHAHQGKVLESGVKYITTGWLNFK